MLQKSFPQVLRSDLVRYFAASLLALAADMATLSISLRLIGFSVAWAATTGFMAGVLVTYLLSIRWVFRERAFANSPALEFIAFVVIGLAGLGITQLVMWIGVTELGWMPELVKLTAAGATFAFNYIARKSLLFANRSRTEASQESVA